MKKQIGIIGMGHLGSLLAQKIKNNYHVVGLTKNSQPTMDGVEHINVDLDQELVNQPIWKSDTLILSFPPSKVGNYPEVISRIQNKSPNSKIIMVSSISVYGNDQGRVDEQSPLQGNKNIIQAETELHDHHYILRLGGIVSDQRKPWHYMEAKQKDHDEYLHLVDIEDCINAIHWLLKNNPEQKTLNIVNSQRVLKSLFYQQKCIIKPTYGKLLENAKLVSNQLSISIMGLKYEDL